jgi:anti-sigma B factor antagonist
MSNNKPFESEIIDGDILAIILNGALDAASTPEFDKAIQAHLDAGCSKIIIDCRNMPYISSLGMGSLIVLQTKLKRRGGAVKLSAVFGTAMEVMRMVGIDKVLGIYGDLEFARQSFYPQGQAPQRP